MKNMFFAENVLPAFALIRVTYNYDEISHELIVKVSGHKVNVDLFDIVMKQSRINIYLTDDEFDRTAIRYFFQVYPWSCALRHIG